MSLKTKMLAMILLPVVLLTGIMSIYTYYHSKSNLEAQLLETNRYTVRYYSELLNQQLSNDESRLKQLAADLAGRNVVTEGQLIDLMGRNFVAAGSEANMQITATYEVGANFANVVLADDYDGRTRSWYKEAKTTNDVFYTDLYQDATSGNMVVSMGKSIVNNGQFEGALCDDLDITALLNVFKDTKIGKTGYIFLVDRQGAFISHPKFTAKDDVTSVLGGALKHFYDEGKKSNDCIMETINVEGVDRMYASVPVGNTGWLLCTSVDYDEMFSSVHDMAVMLSIGCLAIMLILGAIVWMAIVKITNSIKPLVDMANRMSNGDFRNVDNIAITDDEIGILTKAMQDMRQELVNLMRQINGSSEQVAAASEELTATAEQSAMVSNQIAESVNNVAEGSNQQVKSVNTVVGEVDSINSSVQVLTENTKKAVDLSEEAAENAEKGTKAVESVVTQMTAIETAVGDSAAVVENLGERSKEIGQIVDTISGIAGQTNLLALNAAIEAARAGEQGKGFAVVAEEVRKLAEQSQESAKHIAEIISQIQLDTSNAVSTMEKGTREVEVGAEYVKNAGSIFREIADVVEKVNAQVQSSMDLVKEIERGTEQIKHSTGEIYTATQRSSDETQSVSAATEEQTASMNEISTASHSLALQAEKLQNELSKFRL